MSGRSQLTQTCLKYRLVALQRTADSIHLRIGIQQLCLSGNSRQLAPSSLSLLLTDITCQISGTAYSYGIDILCGIQPTVKALNATQSTEPNRWSRLYSVTDS